MIGGSVRSKPRVFVQCLWMGNSAWLRTGAGHWQACGLLAAAGPGYRSGLRGRVPPFPRLAVRAACQSILFRRVVLALNDQRDSQRVRAGGSAEGDRASQAQDVRPVVAVSARHGAFNPSSRPSVHPFGAFCTRRTTSPRLAVCDGGPSSGVLTSDDGHSSRCPPPVVLLSRKWGAPVGAPLHEAQKAGCGSRSPYSRLPDTYRHNACTG